MKKNRPIWLLILCYSFFPLACNTTSPEKYFDEAILNCNLMIGFSNNGLLRELESPSLKLIPGTVDKTVAMKRKEVIDNKIQFLETNFEKLKQLKETSDTRNMLHASVSLYEFVLPVYKNEYSQLAKLYDDNAPKEQLQLLAKDIHDKYYVKFDQLFNDLINTGKPYADKNNIKVDWGSH